MSNFSTFGTTTPNPPSSEDYIHAKVSLINSINYSFIYLMCIIAPFIINQIGCQLTMLVGIALSLVGTILPAVFTSTSLWIWWLGYGIANGTGNAIMYISSSVVLEQYFQRHFGLASGIQSVGSGITYITVPFLWQYLLDLGPTVAHSKRDSHSALSAGLSLTMYSSVIMCALIIPMLPLFSSPVFVTAHRQNQLRLRAQHTSSSVAINTEEDSSASLNDTRSLQPFVGSRAEPVPSAPMRALYYLFDIPPPELHHIVNQEHTDPQPTGNPSSSHFREQLRLYLSLAFNRNFFLTAFASLVFMFATAVPDTYSVIQATDRLPDQKSSASRITVAYGVLQTLGKLAVSPLADCFPSLFGRTMISLMGFLGKGVATSLTPVALSFLLRLETFFVVNAFYGLADGLQFGIASALLLSVVGSERFGTALAFSMALTALPTIAGSPVAGFVYDLIKDYTWLFGVSGLVIIFSGLVMIFMDFSRDALATPPDGYQRLETSNEGIIERDSAIATSSSSALSSTSASAMDVGRKKLAVIT